MKAQDAAVGERHDVAGLGPCTVSEHPEGNNEAYSHRTTEGPQRTPVA